MRWTGLNNRSLGIFLAACWILASAPGFAQPSDTDRRIALVIGNADYSHVEHLRNPGNDAKLIADTLQHEGFKLVGGGPQRDLDKQHFDQAVQEFGRQIQGAEVALFYYAGHGIQIHDTNWLLPIDANPTRTQDLDFQMVDADLVLKQMDGAGTRLNIVILDACRNNPFANLSTRGVQGGLAQMRAPEGTLISFATQPGNVAVDGSGVDGPYALALADSMRQPDLDIFRLFNQVGLKVKHDTQGNQLPWVSSSPIDGDFYFVHGDAAPDSVATPTIDAALTPQAGASRDAAPSPLPPSSDFLQSLKARADSGKPEAQTELGVMYAKGNGVSKDYAAALQLFESAAAQNFPRAQYLTGLMFERGFGVPRDYAAALQWYRRAAEQNFPPAEVAVGRFYGRGIVVERDPEQRVVWMRRAADQGGPLAQHILGTLYRNGAGVPQDKVVAAQWFQRAAAQGFVLSELQLGLMYQRGAGVPQDNAQALQWLRRAADKGNAVAQNAVGAIYLHGRGVPLDHAAALDWFRQAADQGNTLAEFNLGVIYADGLGVPRDKATAIQWFQKAAAAGNEQATTRLARLESHAGPAQPMR
jgi:TPR repeat protein